jgi:hypothetical protein
VSAIINNIFHSGKFCFDNKPPIYLSRFFPVLSPYYKDALLWCTYDAAITISTTSIAKRKVDYDDRGEFNMFQELMHSWVGYKLVKVLLAFGLSPKNWDDLESWSPDLFNLFSYLGDKQQDPSKKEYAEELLTFLFDKTLHNGYFGKLPFGNKDNFAKMTNTTLPLVMLMWLRQLEEYFYKIGDTNESRNWNTHGKYCPVKARSVTNEFPLENIHMSKANNTTVEQITSVSWIKSNNKINKKVVASLEEWAAKILCRDNDYVKYKATADNKTKKRFDRTKTHGPKQYAMSNRSYKLNYQDTRNSVHIVHFTPKEQQHKSQDQLCLHVGYFMKGEIDKMTKTTDKKNPNQKNIKLLNSANKVAACLVALANKDRHEKIFIT